MIGAQRGGNWAQWQSRNLPQGQGRERKKSTGWVADAMGQEVAASEDSQDMAGNLQAMQQDMRERMVQARLRFSTLDQAESTETACGPLNPIHVWCRGLEKSPKFVFLVAAAIMGNVVAMTAQADYPNFDIGKQCTMKCMVAMDANSSALLGCPDWCLGNSGFWESVNHGFLLFFTLELTIRLFASGGCFGFFCNTSGEQGWNMFDSVIVFTCWFTWSVQVAAVGGGQYFNLLRSLRMLRMLRVLRIFRVPFLKRLNIIVTGLIESIPSGFWVACMLGGVMFVSAIFCTDLIGKSRDQWPEEDRPKLEEWFGSMGRSMDTLFQFLTLADWSAVTRVVATKCPEMMYFFLAYVIFAAMVILSLLTGVMADHINSVNNQAEEEMKAETNEMARQAWTAEFKAFQKATSYTGHTRGSAMTKDEFRKLIHDKKIRQELGELGITFDENIGVDDLFLCMDRSGNGLLTFSEFQAGMEELRVGVTGKQVFKLEVCLRSAVRCCEPQEELAGDPSIQQDVRDGMMLASSRLDEVQARMGSLMDELASFVPPPDADPRGPVRKAC